MGNPRWITADEQRADVLFEVGRNRPLTPVQRGVAEPGHAVLDHLPHQLLGDQRRDVLLADGLALRGGQPIDGALGVKDGVDPPHRLDGKRGA